MSGPSLLKTWLLGQASSLPRILLLDGGVSTHLESKGVTFAHRALWSSSLLLTQSGRDAILAGHEDWLSTGGVNLISTVTYQCHYNTRQWPDHHVIRNAAHMDDLWHQAVDLAAQAVQNVENKNSSKSNKNGHNTYHGIVASSGCFGAALANGAEYTGNYGADCTPAVLQEFHARKLETIQDLPVDAVALETIPSLAECQALRDLFVQREQQQHDHQSSLPMACWISLACRNGHELNDGTAVTTALDVLQEIPSNAVQALGFNCCHASDLPALLRTLCHHYRQNYHQQRGIVLYPNSGETWNAQEQTWQENNNDGSAAKDMAQHLLQCIQQIESDMQSTHAATVPRIIIGGCCRTTPADLASLRQLVKEHLNKDEEKQEQ